MLHMVRAYVVFGLGHCVQIREPIVQKVVCLYKVRGRVLRHEQLCEGNGNTRRVSFAAPQDAAI
jgi:hypothetical protein